MFSFKDYYDSDTRQQLLEKFVQSLLEQYEEASRSISTHSYWLKQTLFPHLEAFYEVRIIGGNCCNIYIVPALNYFLCEF